MEERVATTFAVGQTIQHANHGVGEIVSIEEQSYAGTRLQCYVVMFMRDKLTLRIPTRGSGVSDMRPVNAGTNLDHIFKTLNEGPKNKRRMWAHRERDLRIALYSGNLATIASVVRDLYGDTSYSALQIYDEAMQRLVAEIATIRTSDEQEALAFINKQLTDKVLTLPKTYDGIRRNGITPNPLSAERHIVAKPQKLPSAMEERLDAKDRKAEPVSASKPSEWAAAEAARRMTARRAGPPPTPALAQPSPPAPAAMPKIAAGPVMRQPVVATTPARVQPEIQKTVAPKVEVPARVVVPEVTAKPENAPTSPECSSKDAATIAALQKALKEAEAGKAALIEVNRSLEAQVEEAVKKRTEAEARFQKVIPIVTAAEATKRQLAELHTEHARLATALKTALANNIDLRAKLAVQAMAPVMPSLDEMMSLRKQLTIAKRSLTMANKREEKLLDEAKKYRADLRKLEKANAGLLEACNLLEERLTEIEAELPAEPTNEQAIAQIAEAQATMFQKQEAALKRKIEKLEKLLREARQAAKEAAMTRVELLRIDAARRKLLEFIEQNYPS